eukprot:6207941-Pleurochrysis_carterae.AAC.1
MWQGSGTPSARTSTSNSYVPPPTDTSFDDAALPLIGTPSGPNPLSLTTSWHAQAQLNRQPCSEVECAGEGRREGMCARVSSRLCFVQETRRLRHV